MPDIAISTLCELSHIIFTITLQVRDYYFDFIGEETEGHTWRIKDLELKHKKSGYKWYACYCEPRRKQSSRLYTRTLDTF